MMKTGQVIDHKKLGKGTIVKAEKHTFADKTKDVLLTIDFESKKGFFTYESIIKDYLVG